MPEMQCRLDVLDATGMHCWFYTLKGIRQLNVTNFMTLHASPFTENAAFDGWLPMGLYLRGNVRVCSWRSGRLVLHQQGGKLSVIAGHGATCCEAHPRASVHAARRVKNAHQGDSYKH